MINGKQLEVLLDTRKEVVANNLGQSLDMLLRLRAPAQVMAEGDTQERTSLAISLVIDRSGSMNCGKLAEAKRCALNLLDRLSDEDRISVVIYDERVEVLLEMMAVRMAKTFLPTRLEAVEPRGTTALHQGWLKGAETLAPGAGRGVMSRVILLSDGQANHGLTHVDSICEQVRELASAGVSTSTVGIGLGFNEELMTAIANAGQGNSWYGERSDDLAESFDAELSSLTTLVWQDVRVKLETPLLPRLGQIKVRNDYVKDARDYWCLPSIAVQSEVWMGISLSMHEVIRLQESGTVLRCIICTIDQTGREYEFSVTLPQLPVVGLAEYRMATENELVARRFNEIESADIQREARAHVKVRNWEAVEGLIEELETKGKDNPWLTETVKYLRKLLELRDHEAMEKELMYSSSKLKNRSASLNDSMLFCMSMEALEPAHLRKKVAQGRNTDSQS